MLGGCAWPSEMTVFEWRKHVVYSGVRRFGDFSDV